MRLSASPHAIAVGVAAGTLSAFTPFFGFHILLAVALAYVLAGNVIAAALATAFANPLTFPLICAATFETGAAVLGAPASGHSSAAELFHLLEHLQFAELWQPVLKPMLVGAGVLGGASAALAYGLTLFGVRLFQERRRLRIRMRHHDGQGTLAADVSAATFPNGDRVS